MLMVVVRYALDLPWEPDRSGRLCFGGMSLLRRIRFVFACLVCVCAQPQLRRVYVRLYPWLYLSRAMLYYARDAHCTLHTRLCRAVVG